MTRTIEPIINVIGLLLATLAYLLASESLAVLALVLGGIGCGMLLMRRLATT